MFYLYNLTLGLFFPFFFIFMIVSLLFIKKWRKGFFKKLGFYKTSNVEKESIIFHCVSVGETLAAVPLIKKMAERNKNIIFSVTTQTGYDVASKQLSRFVKEITFFPYDFPFAIERFFSVYRPKAIIIMETELWPNIIYFARRNRIPVIFVNGRISDRSFPRYLRYGFFFKSFLHYPIFLMQTFRDKERIISLGADEGKVFVTGNIKYDLEKINTPMTREEVGINCDDIVLLAGSTHNGEEKILLDAFTLLRNEFKNLKLIIAPRHPERFEEVFSMISQKGFLCGRRSKNEKVLELYLLDTVGELFNFYSLADIAFVGGSLVNIGGHNIIEAAHYGIPVLFGPYMQNFLEISKEFVSEKGGFIVDKENIVTVISNFLQNKEERLAAGRRAKAITLKNQGSLERTLKIIESNLAL